MQSLVHNSLMLVDFLSVLNSSNSTKNDMTGEITITTPLIQSYGKYTISSPCKITSNCNTIIQSEVFEVSASSVSFSNITFHSAIVIHDTDNVSITNCTVKNSKSADGAIEVTNSKDIKLSHITITNTVDLPGLYVYKNSVIAADNLLMHDLSKSFIAVNNGSKVIITDSTLHHTKGNAFYVADQSYIEIYNSSISYASYPALFIRDSECIAKSNTFQNIEENAISIHSSKNFIIEKNTINKVSDTAIQISDDSTGVIKDNTIYDVEGNGIYSNNSDLQIKNNDIFDLIYPAIAITYKSKASLVGNKIYNIKHSGICIRNAKEVTIEDSEIKDICESGISVSDTKVCTIQNNKITNCNLTSIEAYNKSNVYIKNNIISHMKNHAFIVYTSGYMKVEDNQIDDIKGEMVKMTYKGGGDFINNIISNCSKQNICQTSSPYLLSGNGDFKNITNDPSRLSSDNLIHLEDPYIENDHLCLKCHKKKRDCYLLICGHKAYCKECAESALKNHENCPLCRFPIFTVSEGFGNKNEDVCLICCENHSDCIILPCGHTGTCSSCLENWFDNNQTCPICRAEPCLYKQIENDF